MEIIISAVLIAAIIGILWAIRPQKVVSPTRIVIPQTPTTILLKMSERNWKRALELRREIGPNAYSDHLEFIGDRLRIAGGAE